MVLCHTSLNTQNRLLLRLVVIVMNAFLYTCCRLRTAASLPLQMSSPVSCLAITNGAAHILVGLRDANLIVLTSPSLSQLKA